VSAGTIALRLVIGGDASGGKAALKSLGTESKKAQSGLGKGLKAAQQGAAIGLAAIVGVATKGVQSYEALTKSVAALQRQSKISAEDASLLTGQWQRYGVAAEAGGKGMMMLSKQIDAANIGTKTSIDTFARLGVTLDDLKTMSPYQVLEQVRQTLSEMPPSAERTALSAKLLGKGFMTMSKWIAASSTDLDALNQQLKDSGQVMDEAELAKAKDDMKQMALLQVDLRGLFVEVGRSAMPIIRDLVPGLKKLLAVVKPLAPHLVEIGGALATFLVVSKVATGLNAMITALRTVKGLGNVVGGGGAGGLGGAVSSGPLDAAISANTAATEANTLALGGKGVGGGPVKTAEKVAEKGGLLAAGVTAGALAALALIPAASGDANYKAGYRVQRVGKASSVTNVATDPFADSRNKPYSERWGPQAAAAMKDAEAAVTTGGGAIARSLRASGDKAGAGLAAGLAHGVGPALQSIQRVRSSAGRPIHMGNLDATQMINEIARVSGALGGMRSAARTAGDAAANAIKSPSGGGGSYRGHFMARGGDFMVRRPTLFVAGEAGLERATFTPQGKKAPGGGSGDTYNTTVQIQNVHGTDRAAATKLANMAGEIFMQQVRFTG
jgi:Tfp pilus assembly major pilin PilA